MHLKRYIAAALTALLFSLPAYAAENAAGSHTVDLACESEPVEGKVNDPVSGKTVRGKIFSGNPSFHVECASSSKQAADIIVYSNTYVEGEDKGVRNRLMKKKVRINESFRLLPEEIYEAGEEDGSLYDFLNQCFVLRVYEDESDTVYKDYYIGIVDDNMFSEMSVQQAERAAAEKERAARLGPALR